MEPARRPVIPHSALRIFPGKAGVPGGASWRGMAAWWDNAGHVDTTSTNMKTLTQILLICGAALCASTALAIDLDPALDEANPLAPFAAFLGGALVTKLCLWMGACRMVAKLVSAKLQELLDAAVQYVRGTATEEDDHWLNSILSSRPYRITRFVVDYFASIKLPVGENAERGTRSAESAGVAPLTVSLITASLITATLLTGCASLDTNAYKTIGTTANLVDGAMRGWGDYVRAGRATPDDESRVRAAYEKYQAAMRAARAAVNTYHTAPDNEVPLQTALSALSSASGEIVNLIGVIVPEKSSSTPKPKP